MDGTAENCWVMGAELLKHIERKKYPERFGFEKIEYKFENNEIFIVWTKGNKAIRIPFLEGWDDTIRMSVYEFLAHYFGNPVPKIQLQEQNSEKTNYLEA